MNLNNLKSNNECLGLEKQNKFQRPIEKKKQPLKPHHIEFVPVIQSPVETSH